MGWTTCYNAKHFKMSGFREVVDRRKECDDMLTFTSHDDRGNTKVAMKVLKSAMVGSTYYGAVETTTFPGEGQEPFTRVFAAVFLTKGKGRDGTIWGYKDMDESMGPNEAKCPLSILKLLSPAPNEWAENWRKECREYAEKQRAKRALKKN